MHLCSVVIVLLASLHNAVFAQFPSYPPMLLPSSGDVWNVGELRTVEWGITSDMPATNSSGQPLLGQLILGYDSGLARNPVLLGNYKLASDVPLSQKMVNIIVPDVPTRKDYSIFMNSQGGLSWSGGFEIFNPKDPQGTGAAPTSISVTPAPPISVTVVLPTPTDNGAASTTSSTASPTTSSSSTASSATSSATGTPNNGACPRSRSDLLAQAGVVLIPLTLLVHLL